MKFFIFLIIPFVFLFANSKKEIDSKILLQKAVKAYKEESYITARKYYMQACKLGNMTGCSGLGTLYERGLGVIMNLKKAREYYHLACSKGDTFGCFHLQMLESGEMALDYYSVLCDDEDASACLKIGNLYYQGIGIPKNQRNSAIYYQRACNLKNAQGCFNLGVLYDNGEGDLKVDREIALAYFYLAKQYFYLDCKAKKVSACNMLKSMEAFHFD